MKMKFKIFKKISVSLLTILVFTTFSFPLLALAQSSNNSILNVDASASANERSVVPQGGTTISAEGLPADQKTQTEEVEIDVQELWGGAAQGCFTQVLANTIVSLVGDVFKGAAAKLSAKAEEAAFGILNVPVRDQALLDELRRLTDKEVGTQITFVRLPALDGLAWCLGNALIEQLLIATTQWVLNGYEGNPVFVDDPEQFFLDILDHEAAKSLNELTETNLCAPFSVNIRLGLLKDYVGGYGNACSLSEIGENFELFLDGSFGEDGWRQWFHITQNPQNNPIGSQTILFDAFYHELEQRQNAVNVELGWNNGFISKKSAFTGETLTPGSLVAEQLFGQYDSARGRITFADEFDELVSVLINEVVKVALSEVTDVF
jgi:hypothetical protein